MGCKVGAGVRRVRTQGWMEGGWLAVVFDWDGLLPVQVLQLVRRHVQPECVRLHRSDKFCRAQAICAVGVGPFKGSL